jgi:RsiW-degrading membrane proteinase PrsW (M82 family)
VDIWLILLIATAPGLFWLWYFYKRDEYEPEPLHLMALLFFLGLAAALIAGVLELGAGQAVTGMVFFIIAVPVIEESVKFLMVLLFAYRNREFDEPMDGIVYATATALGFATLENAQYLLDLASPSSVLVTGAVRGILTVPAHALFGICWGYALGIAKFSPKEKRVPIITGGLVLGIAVHALFNFLMEQSYPGFAVLLLVILPLTWWGTEKKIRAALLAPESSRNP